MSWAVLGATVLVVVAMVTNVLVPVATTVLGGTLGAMATRMLVSKIVFRPNRIVQGISLLVSLWPRPQSPWGVCCT